MKPAEWVLVAQEMQARWPNRVIEDATLEVWFDDVRDLSFEQIRTAMRGFSRDGREFCPTGGQLRAKAVELGRGDPDHGEAWRLVYDALAAYAPNEWGSFYAHLRSISPAVAEAARRFNFEGQGGYLKDEEPTVRAQFREIYKSVCGERQRDGAYAGLPVTPRRGELSPASGAIGQELARLEKSGQ